MLIPVKCWQLVNQPSYNPNDPTGHDTDGMRNRAVTDVIEPGSVMKPIAIASVLENGIAVPSTPVETSPGYTVISGHTIRDHNNYALLDVTGVLTTSSNVGVTQLALQLEPEQMWIPIPSWLWRATEHRLDRFLVQ